MNEKRSEHFAIEQSVRQGYPLSPLHFILASEPLLHRLRDQGANPALFGIPFASQCRAFSTFTDDITEFMSSHSDREAVKKVVGRYK